MSRSENASLPNWKVPAIVGTLILLLWLGNLFLGLWLGEDGGAFGDMFGAVNALFSGLAFAGVIYAVLLQRQELQLQRRELELTRTELEGQKIALNAQNETLRRQSFENTFFQLLRLHGDIVNSIDIGETRGKDCFKILFQRFQNQFSKRSNQGIEGIAESYSEFYKHFESDLGHYFRSLYNIFKLVDASTVPDKSVYTNLARAQLSSFELCLLFYNCLSDFGSEKFKPLVEKYALLKTMPFEKVMKPDHLGLYNNSAFGKGFLGGQKSA